MRNAKHDSDNRNNGASEELVKPLDEAIHRLAERNAIEAAGFFGGSHTQRTSQKTETPHDRGFCFFPTLTVQAINLETDADRYSGQDLPPARPPC